MEIAKSKRVQPGYEPIEGYVLEKRIGQGGYGEVWRAVAPGGLKKAVKFVFGQHDERRAEQELKSLERIKGVHHPFILTLERFQLIEGQLVIVTELADGSLEDIYKQHRKRGSCGIPREALLRYMRDAADALDYLHQLYKLQHLDIKPANLLIVGGRVKVADFGLLKDLGDSDCSMVGGLTPIYAPPEVFDGRPSLHSDQYSLAVMYQELLTSTRPFTGRSIAQLATQHVHNAPNLKPLPACDLPSVARALEKCPERRYKSCTEFVDRLINPHGNAAVVADEGNEATPPESNAVKNLPRLSGAGGVESAAKQTQALVVALGGSGADCLGELRSRLYELGAGSPWTMHSVLIDTDRETTQRAAMIEATDVVPRCRVVDATLRTANEYRQRGTERLKTISRRWIYNVPRNGQTNGMRPLGRLALVDHGEQVMGTLRDAVDELKRASAEGTHPKIYVVGSLTGGSGSGMYIDVVYLLRHLLDRSAMEQEPIVSLLTTDGFKSDPARPLTLHAARAAIAELAYFLDPANSYPGDVGAGWPSVPAARTPLHNTYLITPSDAPGAPSAISAVVNYLWADATDCGQWFADGRADDSPAGPPAIRSLGVIEIGDPGQRRSSLLASPLTKSLLLRWLGNPVRSEKAAKEFVSRIVRRCHLNIESLSGLTERWLGSSPEIRQGKLIQSLKSMETSVLQREDSVRSNLLRWLTGAMNLDQGQTVATEMAQQMDREIQLRLQDARLDLSSSLVGLSELRKHLASLQHDLMRQSDHAARRLADPTAGSIRPSESDSPNSSPLPQSTLVLLEKGCELGERLINVVACRVAADLTKKLDEKLAEMSEIYRDASARVAQGIQKLTQTDTCATDPWSAVDEPVRNQVPTLLRRLHDQTVAQQLLQVIRSPSSFDPDSLVSKLSLTATAMIRGTIETEAASCDAGGDTDFELRGPQRAGTGDPSESTDTSASATTTFLTDELAPSTMRQTHSWSGESATPPALTVKAALLAVRPPLLQCGGKQRIYLICRDQTEQRKLESQLPRSEGISLTPLLARLPMPMLVHEAQGIELRHVMALLDSLTGDQREISRRLATRCDLDGN